MKWIEARVEFDAPDPETAGDLIAAIFTGMGLSGVVMQTPMPDAGIDWDRNALPFPDRWGVTGYFPENSMIDARKKNLEAGLAELYGMGIVSRVTYTRIDDCNWTESWKTHFHPVRISDTLVVKPTWRDFEASSSDIVIEIDPGMAFGTGTHATTRLCLQLIEQHIQDGDRMLDIGTGSGILMVAAARLGAARVFGLDTDEVAVETARQNLLKNRVAPDVSDLFIGTVDALSGRCFDLICANIITETIVDIIPGIRGLMRISGRFICSGIPEERKDDLLPILKNAGFVTYDIMERDGWIAIAAGLET